MASKKIGQKNTTLCGYFIPLENVLKMKDLEAGDAAENHPFLK